MTLVAVACQEKGEGEYDTRTCIETHIEDGKYVQRTNNVSGGKEAVEFMYGEEKVHFLDF